MKMRSSRLLVSDLHLADGGQITVLDAVGCISRIIPYVEDGGALWFAIYDKDETEPGARINAAHVVRVVYEPERSDDA